MIPTGGILTNAPIEVVKRPSLTWKLDFAKGKISGNTDGLDAVRQAVYKILQTPRYRHWIYSFRYGHELDTLIGSSPLFIRSEMTRMLSEALMQDDRVTGIADLSLSADGDSLLIEFVVETRFGTFPVTQEVGNGV